MSSPLSAAEFESKPSDRYVTPATFDATKSFMFTCLRWRVLADNDDVSQEEKDQVTKSRQDIAAGQSKRYKNAAEYLKSLDEESE